MVVEDIIYHAKAGRDVAIVMVDKNANKYRFETNGSNLLLTRNGTTLQTISTGNSAPGDDVELTFGATLDGAIILRSTALNANTALAGVVVGTPVTTAIAANSMIYSNITTDGDVLVVATNGGNSQAWAWIDSSAGLAQLLGAGTPVFEWTATKLEVPDSILFTLGSDNDQAALNRATALGANTALTGVVVGTPVTPAVAANSLIVSNITADGDHLFACQTGGNSQAYLFRDVSAGDTYLFGGAGVEAAVLKTGITIVNDTAADIDFRVEGDTNANMHVIDAGTDSQSFGSAVVAGAAVSVGNATSRTLVTAVGNQIHVPAVALTDGGANGTIAELAVARVGVETVVATNTITYSDAASLVVALPVASTGATFTRKYAIWAKGEIRTLTNLQIGDNTAAFGTTQPTGSAIFQSGTAPVGAIVTGGALFASTTVMRKIIADGTASNVET